MIGRLQVKVLHFFSVDLPKNAADELLENERGPVCMFHHDSIQILHSHQIVLCPLIYAILELQC